jgi:hypothetical protein
LSRFASSFVTAASHKQEGCVASMCRAKLPRYLNVQFGEPANHATGLEAVPPVHAVLLSDTTVEAHLVLPFRTQNFHQCSSQCPRGYCWWLIRASKLGLPGTAAPESRRCATMRPLPRCPLQINGNTGLEKVQKSQAAPAYLNISC